MSIAIHISSELIDALIKYNLEINGYKQAKYVFTISELDSAILGCHGISSKTLLYYPCKKDLKNLNKIRKFRINN